jgi:hypothetical protein
MAATAKAWAAWKDSDAVDFIPPGAASLARQELEQNNELNCILQMRHLFADNNDG